MPAALSEADLLKGCAEINEKIDEYEAISDKGLLQALVEWILIFMLERGFAVKERVRPEYVGVHPCNRGGTGLVASSVVALLQFILRNGWSWRLVSKDSAVEIAPDDTAIQEFNDRLVKNSGGLLASRTHEIRLASLDVHYNEQCNSWFIRYSDVEGRQHTKHFAWVRNDIEDVSNQHREEAARKAQSEFDSLNVVPAEAAGDA